MHKHIYIHAHTHTHSLCLSLSVSLSAVPGRPLCERPAQLTCSCSCSWKASLRAASFRFSSSSSFSCCLSSFFFSVSSSAASLSRSAFSCRGTVHNYYYMTILHHVMHRHEFIHYRLAASLAEQRVTFAGGLISSCLTANQLGTYRNTHTHTHTHMHAHTHAYTHTHTFTHTDGMNRDRENCEKDFKHSVKKNICFQISSK